MSEHSHYKLATSSWHKLPYSQKLLSISLLLFVFVLPLAIVANSYTTEFRNQAAVSDGTVRVLLETPPEGITSDIDTQIIVKVNTQGASLSKLQIKFDGTTPAYGLALPTFQMTPILPLRVDPSTEISLVGNPNANSFIAQLVLTEAASGVGFSSTEFVEVGRLQLKVHALDFNSRLDITVDNTHSFAYTVNSTTDILTLANPIYAFPILPNPNRCLERFETSYTQYCPSGKHALKVFDEQLQCHVMVCAPQSTGEPNPIDWDFGDKFHLRSTNFVLEIDGQKLFVNPSAVHYAVGEHIGSLNLGTKRWTGLLRNVAMYWTENGVPYRWYIQLVQYQDTLKWEMIYSNVEKYRYSPGSNQVYSVYFEPLPPEILQVENLEFPPDLSLHISNDVQLNDGTHTGTMTFNKVVASADPDPLPTMTPTPTDTLTPTATLPPCTHPSGKKADFNDDGVVNLTDYALLVREFLKDLTVYKADANCDGQVNLTDYAILVREFLR